MFRARTPVARVLRFDEATPATPGTRSPQVSPNPNTSPPRSPALAEYNGATLETLCDLSIDWCTLVVMVQGVPKPRVRDTMQTLRTLLRKEGVRFRKVPENKPFHERSLQLVDAEQMRRLMCKLPGRLTHVVREAQ